MARVTYEVVEHDGGWAYSVGRDLLGDLSDAGGGALARPSVPPASSRTRHAATDIAWEDERGRWHTEASPGDDRPETEVEGWEAMPCTHLDTIRTSRRARAAARSA